MTDFKKIQEYYSVFNEDERLTTDYSGKLEYDMTMRKLKNTSLNPQQYWT